MSMIECRTLYGHKKLIPKEKLILRLSAYGIIVNDGKILLVRMRSTGQYSLPGGGVDVGERIEDALKREVREETGIEIEVGEFIHFQEDFFYYNPLDEAFHGLLFFYTCQPVTFDLANDDQVDDDEAERPRWVDLRDLEENSIHQGHRKVVFETLPLETKKSQ